MESAMIFTPPSTGLSGQNPIFLKFVLVLANNADLDEMQHCAAFHLGLHC